MRIAWSFLFVLACGHAPPPKAPAAELPIAAPADLAGTWVADDDLSRGYRMTIGKDSSFELVIDRVSAGKCEQKGKLAPGEQPKQFTLQYEKNECNHDYEGGAIQLVVRSFTGDALAITMVGYGVSEQKTYKRAPAQ